MSAASANAGLTSSAATVPFPVARRTGVVRRCAAELETLHGEPALHYWRAECRRLAEELLALGCDEVEMRLQVLDFQDEVQAELRRRHLANASREGAGRA
ncbi:hypothetical protein SAMN05892877_104204 [Rhizobium subbaraonis]|uniref:Uncharacterized protein n=1 Tax=Rhizobium subbaraonis TaxID=908946 RepID=A0A285U6H7_9HYPH|nr:DUF6074 family protein [Rhizobium subbaraonis]SOC37525.1 hypothetical protein SAMN05892877_104204 [Rhizobium subbaraonis]